MIQFTLIILVIIGGFCVCKKFNKNAILCENLNKFNNIYINSKEKYTFRYLSFSNTIHKINSFIKLKIRPFFFQKEFLANKDYYLTLSKFIDYKINFNKSKYRAKNNVTLVESVASVVVSDFITLDKANIFSSYRHLCKTIKLRQKEKRIVKILIGKSLLEYFSKTMLELAKLSKIITIASYTKKIKVYKNINYMLAELYGIAKFNCNATLLKSVLGEKYKLSTDMFFKELQCYKNRLNRTSHYLKIMFS